MALTPSRGAAETAWRMPKSRSRTKKSSAKRRGPTPRRHTIPPVDGIVRTILRGGDEILDLEDPLDAEVWASGVVGVTYKQPLPIEVQERFPELVLEGILEQAANHPGAGSVATLRALAAVADPGYGALAASIADRLVASGAQDPPWAATIGHPAFRDAWMVRDPYDDQRLYAARFAYDGQPDHLVTALYDENLGAIIKDASVGILGADPRAAAAADPEVTVEDLDAVTFGTEVCAAIASGDLYLDNDWTEGLRDLRALVLARTRILPEGPLPEAYEPPDDAAREALIEEFLASPGAPPDDDVTRAILENCLTARCDYGDGDPLRWSPTVVEMFLMDFVPRKGTLDLGAIRAVPGVLKAWVTFALARRGVAEEWIEETRQTIDELATPFVRRATDPSTFGPAKAMATAMLADGVDLSDEHAMQRWIDDFNARPFEERHAFLPRFGRTT